jgi:hypothetical protein
MTLTGIAENLVSDVLFVALSFAIGWIILVLARRNRLLGFFGIDDNRRLQIYLSNLKITQGGALGIDGTQRSYEGSAGALGEMLAANQLRGLFNYSLPGVEDNQGILSKILISDTRVTVTLSPQVPDDLERTAPLISLGSPAYNAASRYIENNLHSLAQFRLGTSEWRPNIVSPRNPTAGSLLSTSGSPGALVPPQLDYLPTGVNIPSNLNPVWKKAPSQPEQPTEIAIDGIPPITDTNYSFVERIIENGTGRTVFYVAGMSDNATAGAANYLVSDWRQLQKKFGDKGPFLVVLRITPTNFEDSAVIFQKQ